MRERETEEAIEETTEATPGSELEVSKSKFHSLYGRALGVALEARLFIDPSKKLSVDEEYKHLVHAGKDQALMYYLAIANGDMQENTAGEITFVPWFSGRELAAEHRLQFRIRSFDKNSKQLPRLWFFAESGSPAFNGKPQPGRKKKESSKGEIFFHLDFFSNRKEKFLPLFVKIWDEGECVFFVLEARMEENTPEYAMLHTRRVRPEEAPECLIKAGTGGSRPRVNG